MSGFFRKHESWLCRDTKGPIRCGLGEEQDWGRELRRPGCRRIAILVGLAAIALPASAQPTGDELPTELWTLQSGHDWPDFLGPARKGKSDERNLLLRWPEQGPPVVWQVPLGTGYSAPSVSRGRLFHAGRFGNQSRLTCREAETGRELWRCEHPTDYEDMLNYNNGPRCTPVVDGPRVYTFSADGILQCVQVKNGQVVWRVDTMRRFGVAQNFFGVGSTPVVFDDLLIANIGGSPSGSPANVYSGPVSGNGTGIVAFDKRTGKVRWSATDELASYASPVVTTIGDRPWCFVFARGGLIGCDPRTGNVDFTFPWRAELLESVNASTPVVVGPEVFISETYGPGSALLRVRPGDVEEIWTDRDKGRDKSLALHWNTPIEHEGFLYGSSGRHGGPAELRCVEWKTGMVRWRKRGLARSSLLFVEGHLVCLSEDGTLRLIRANPDRYEEVADVVLRDESGAPLLREPAWVAPVLSHGLLYVRGRDRLVCLRLGETPVD